LSSFSLHAILNLMSAELSSLQSIEQNLTNGQKKILEELEKELRFNRLIKVVLLTLLSLAIVFSSVATYLLLTR